MCYNILWVCLASGNLSAGKVGYLGTSVDFAKTNRWGTKRKGKANMKHTYSKKLMSLVLTLALVLAGTLANVNSQPAAAKAKKATLKFKNTSYTVKVGSNLDLKKQISKKNVKKVKSMTWSSKTKTVAKVSKKGVVTGVKDGTTTITCKVKLIAKGAKKTSTKKITTKVKVEKSVIAKPTNKPTVAPSVTPNPELQLSNLGDQHDSKNGIPTKDNGMMRKSLTAQEMTTTMGLGWNIGNSLEQTLAKSCTALSEEEQAALSDADWVKGYETNADNIESTQKMIDGLKAYGINTIRIPVAWSNMMTEEKQEDGTTFYKISDAYMDRVETVMNYCLNDEMYVVFNIHWDNGWWGMFGDKDPQVQMAAWKKYEDMWKQLSARFMEYSDHVIFEGANEELGERLNDNWKGGSGQTGVLSKEETYELTNQINQKFVDLVRESGLNADGKKNNNYYRMLLIPGYDTNLHQTTGDKYSDKVKEKNDKLTFTMPKDKADNGTKRLFVSIHYYDPLGWGLSKSSAQNYDTPKGHSDFADTWGSKEDYAAMQEDFDAVEEAFVKKGYGVIFGEFGVLSVNKDGIPDYFRQFFKSCKKLRILPVMWDEGTYVSRNGSGNLGEAYFVYSDIGEVFTEITGQKPKLKADAEKQLTLTGIPENPVIENQDPLVVATWEGDFMRNTTTSEAVDLDYIKKTFGDKFINEYSKNKVGAIFDTKKITINPNYDLDLIAHASSEWWHSHYQISDWTKIKEPCIRITMHDDEYSQSADLQLVYSDSSILNADKGAAWRYERDFEQVQWADQEEYTKLDGSTGKRTIAKKNEDGSLQLADTAWIGKCLKLDPEILKNYPVVLLTTNYFMGVDFVKVEICDGAYNADGTDFQKTEGKQ